MRECVCVVYCLLLSKGQHEPTKSCVQTKQQRSHERSGFIIFFKVKNDEAKSTDLICSLSLASLRSRLSGLVKKLLQGRACEITLTAAAAEIFWCPAPSNRLSLGLGGLTSGEAGWLKHSLGVHKVISGWLCYRGSWISKRAWTESELKSSFGVLTTWTYFPVFFCPSD